MSQSQSNSPSPQPSPSRSPSPAPTSAHRAAAPATKRVVKKKAGLKFKAKKSQVVDPPAAPKTPTPEPSDTESVDPAVEERLDDLVDQVCPPVSDKRYALKGKNRWSRFFESQEEMEAFDGADGTGYYLKGQTASCCGKVFRKKYPKGLHYKTCDGTVKRCGNDGYTFVGGVCKRIDGTRRRGAEPDWCVGISKKFKALKIDCPLDDTEFQTLDAVRRFITDPESFEEHIDSFTRLVGDCELFEDEFKSWVEGHSDITSTTKTITTDGFTGREIVNTSETQKSFRDYITECLSLSPTLLTEDMRVQTDQFIERYF